MIHTIYCTEPVYKQHPRLVPVVRVFLNDWGLDPAEAARQAARRHTPPNGPWALMDQPPNWNGHTYKSNFGGHDIYNWSGLGRGAQRLREWMQLTFSELRHVHGYYSPPMFMPIDWEGHYFPLEFDRGKFDKTVERYTRLAMLRAEAIRYCVVEPANQVWGVQIDASNYEDRPGVASDKDSNGWPYPAVGVQGIASPVAYTRLDREPQGSSADGAAFNAASKLAYTFAKCIKAGVRCIPWMAPVDYVGDSLPRDMTDPGKVIFEIAEAVGLEECILWGPGQAATQKWLIEK